LLAIVAATNAVADQDGPAAERTGGITGGPTIQHAGTRLARASTAFMHDKCTKEHVFLNQKFASLHGDLDFSNIPQSIYQTISAALQLGRYFQCLFHHNCNTLNDFLALWWTAYPLSHCKVEFVRTTTDQRSH
jgi:hypothetical protein